MQCVGVGVGVQCVCVCVGAGGGWGCWCANVWVLVCNVWGVGDGVSRCHYASRTHGDVLSAHTEAF